jgi:tetratricopeptide (TPR) repeat protein
MGKFAVLIIILLLGALALFSIVNNDTTTINVPFDRTYEIPKMGLILVSSVVGALAMLLVLVVRDTKRYLVTYQFQKQKKREEKVQSLYSKAINAILADNDVDARNNLQEILNMDSEHADALLRLGDIVLGKDQLEEALGYYKRALSSSPKNLEALFSIVEVMERSERWSEALDSVEDILEADTDNLSALHKKRGLLEREGRWDDVIDVQKTVLKYAHDGEQKHKEQTSMLGYRYELARDSLEKGELEKANKGFRAILREDKGFIPAYLGVAEAMLGGNEPEAAMSFLEKGYEQTGSQIILARLEDLMINLGEPSRLIRTYKKTISENPQDNIMKFFLGKLYFRLEMIDDAFEVLSSLDMVEGFADLYKLLGELYFRRNQCDKAVEQFKKTLEMKRTLRVPYCCSVCGRIDMEWSGRCPECGNWNTYRFDLYGTCEV